MTPSQILLHFDRAAKPLKLQSGKLLGPRGIDEAERALITLNKPALIAELETSETIPCPGDGCGQTVRLYGGRGWCRAHGMKIRMEAK